MFDFVVGVVQYFNDLEFDQVFKIMQKFIFLIKLEALNESTMSNIFEKVKKYLAFILFANYRFGTWNKKCLSKATNGIYRISFK